MRHRLQALAPSTLVPVLARRKTLLVLAQCTPQLALETRTLQEQARRNRRQAHVQPLFRSAQAPWCGALPTVRGKQLSDRRCPLNPGEQEEAEIPTVRGKQIE